MDTLPDETLVRILGELPYPSLNNVSEVDHRLHAISKDSLLWDRLYREQFSSSSPSTDKFTRAQFIKVYTASELWFLEMEVNSVIANGISKLTLER